MLKKIKNIHTVNKSIKLIAKSHHSVCVDHMLEKNTRKINFAS